VIQSKTFALRWWVDSLTIVAEKRGIPYTG
jgi:hypothetical protein